MDTEPSNQQISSTVGNSNSQKTQHNNNFSLCGCSSENWKIQSDLAKPSLHSNSFNYYLTLHNFARNSTDTISTNNINNSTSTTTISSELGSIDNSPTNTKRDISGRKFPKSFGRRRFYSSNLLGEFLLVAVCVFLLPANKNVVSGTDCNPKFVPPPNIKGEHLEQVFNKLKTGIQNTKLVAKKDEYNVTFGLCVEVGKKADKTSILVENTRDSTFHSFGHFSEFTVHGNGIWMSIAFQNGDEFVSCKQDNKTTTSVRRYGTVIVHCNKKQTTPLLVAATFLSGRDLVLTLETDITCSDTTPTGTPSSTSTGSTSSASGQHKGGTSSIWTFFIIIVVVVSAYFLCGFLYRRFVMGAQGYEQIPHYILWKRFGRTIQDRIHSLTGRGWPSPSDQSYRDYRDRDEDFHYTSPPMGQPLDASPILSMGGNNDYEPIAPVGPRPPTNPLPSNTRTPSDDQDEKLLQV